MFPPANALPARSEAAEVQPVIGISQRVRMNSKEKKDLGTLGMAACVGIRLMTSFAGCPGCVANGTLPPVLCRLCAGHYYDGDHHRYWSWHHLGLHLQEVGSFSSWLPWNRAKEERRCQVNFSEPFKRK